MRTKNGVCDVVCVCMLASVHMNIDTLFAMMSTKKFAATFGSNIDSSGSVISDKVPTSFPSEVIAILPKSHHVTLHSGMFLPSLQF